MITPNNLHVWIYFWIIWYRKIESSSSISYNQPNLPKCARWNVNGITFANKTIVGQFPKTIFIDKNNTVFAANNNQGNVKEWQAGNPNVTRTIFKNLNEPQSLFVTNDKTIYVDNGENGKVEKWSSNATESAIAMNVKGACYGLFVDFMNNLYCSLGNQNQVVRQSLEDSGKNTSKTIVAGNDTCGSSSTMLCEPHGIFVTVELELYVADCRNNRIQLFKSEQIIGETLNIQLVRPTYVFVDADNYLFIVDWGNRRIIRSNSNGFYCIIGCLKTDSSSFAQSQLPFAAVFDSYGNIFVVDTSMQRIQKFILQTDSTDQTSSIIELIYSSVLTETNSKYSPDDCKIVNQHYYEAIEIQVSSDGCYTFGNQSNRNIITYVYQNEFDVFKPKLNLLVQTQTNFEIYLEATAKYVLVVTTHLPNTTGFFSIYVFGPSEVKFNRIKTSSVVLQTTYTSELTIDSAKYFHYSDEPDFYYETIQINVAKDDLYIFNSNSTMSTIGYIYKEQFNPFEPSLNVIESDDDNSYHNKLRLVVYLEKRYTYILVITTYAPYILGSFSIVARGSNKITLKSINASSIIARATYSSELNSNSSKYFPDSIESDFSYEAIQINVLENGTYAFKVNGSVYIQSYFYKDKFDPFNPYQNEIKLSHTDQLGFQFQMTTHLYAETTYILVITTLMPKMIGFFSVTAFGSSLVTLKYMNSSSVILQAIYPSELSNSSAKYSQECIEPNYYYDAFQITVIEDGTHTFDPSNPSLNQINRNDDDAVTLQKKTVYIYVVTTFSPNIIQSFSIIVFGPTNVTLERINTSSTTATPIYWLEFSTNVGIFYPNGIDYVCYYEAIQVHVLEDGIYAFGCGGTLGTNGYIYEDNFNPFNPDMNKMTKVDMDYCTDHSKYSAHLQKTRTYIFIVSIDQLKYFSNLVPVYIIGLNNVTLKRLNSSSVHAKAIYTSDLHTNSHKYSGYCIEPQYYYEAIQINIIEDGFYTFSIDRKIPIHVSIYKNKFTPLHSLLNQMQRYNDIDITEFKLTKLFTMDLQKETTYILIVSTLKSFITGPFSITVLGPNNITLKYMNISTKIAVTTYSSELTINSVKYSWDCHGLYYYYEAIELNIIDDGFYTIGSKSKMIMCGFIYKDKFNAYDPFKNKIEEDCASACDGDNLKITTYLEKKIKYIFVITTFESDEIGSFSIILLGPNNATLRRIDEIEESCFVGTMCSFHEKTIGLTLDDLLRDKIRWNTTLNSQSTTVKICAALTIIMFIGGLINSILSLITFQNVQLRNVGCGMYLFASSITSLITITMFIVKFWFVILTHMTASMNVSAMLWGCKLIEPILKLFLYSDTWLNACVAIERAINVSRGVNFNRAKSKQIARWIIIFLPICVTLTLIHEPIKRNVFEFKTDINKTKTPTAAAATHTRDNYVYCITRYSSSLETYNTIILSTTISCSLRVIIALLPGCANVSRRLWLYLSAYFISFVPSMLIFIIFVLPSKSYKKQFQDTLIAWKRRQYPRQRRQ